MKNDYVPNNLATNSSKRCPIVLCLDISPSMALNNRIQNLNKAVEALLNELEKDLKTKNSVEIAVVTYSTEVYEDSAGFETIGYWKGKKFEPVEEGGSNMSAAVLRSIEIIENRINKYKEFDRDYYIPFFVLVTDGDPCNTDDKTRQEAAISAIKAHCKNMPLIAPYIIGVGEQVEEALLDRFAENFTRKAIILDYENPDVDFKELFAFIGRSITNSLRGAGDLGGLYERICGAAKKETTRIEEIRKVKKAKRM